MDKKEILQQWLEKSNDDLRAAEYLSAMRHPTPIEPDKTHDLEYLLEICQKHNTGFSILSSKIDILNRYSVLPRYPNELEINNEDMKTALSYAKSIQEFVINIFNK